MVRWCIEEEQELYYEEQEEEELDYEEQEEEVRTIEDNGPLLDDRLLCEDL